MEKRAKWQKEQATRRAQDAMEKGPTNRGPANNVCFFGRTRTLIANYSEL